MGLRNLRAICPSCGGKIHAQPQGLGRLTWANSGPLVKTGSECQHCGAALSGKVGIDNRAILVADADKGFLQRAKEEAGFAATQEEHPDEMDQELARRTAEWKQNRPSLASRLFGRN